jgi:hypothetical protein
MNGLRGCPVSNACRPEGANRWYRRRISVHCDRIKAAGSPNRNALNARTGATAACEAARRLLGRMACVATEPYAEQRSLFASGAVLDFFAFDISRRRYLQSFAPQPEAEIHADTYGGSPGQIAAGPRFQRVACTALAAALVAGSLAACRCRRARSWDIGIRFFRSAGDPRHMHDACEPPSARAAAAVR